MGHVEVAADVGQPAEELAAQGARGPAQVGQPVRRQRGPRLEAAAAQRTRVAAPGRAAACGQSRAGSVAAAPAIPPHDDRGHQQSAAAAAVGHQGLLSENSGFNGMLNSPFLLTYLLIFVSELENRKITTE